MRIKSLILIFLFLFVFKSIFTINDFATHPLVYNGNIFFDDITNLVITKYIDIIMYLAIPLLFTVLFLYILPKILSANSIIFSNLKHSYENMSGLIKINPSPRNISIILFFIAVLFKLSLYQFNLDFGNKGSAIIDSYYHGNEFNVYKAYTFITSVLYLITDDFNYYLSILNIILGGATISLWYLIASKTNMLPSIKIILCLIILFYLPLTASETILRTEMLYTFFFTLSILYVINLSREYSTKNLIYLNIILLFCCFIREQTIYILPIYLFFIFIQLDRKYYMSSILSLTITVVATSTIISSYNTSQYGFDSLFRDRVLIQKIMQYGYLDERMRTSYESRLSPDAKLLLQDIVSIYDTNLLPSRREIYVDKYGMPDAWHLIRPHHQTIYQKTNLSSLIKNQDVIQAQNIIISLLSAPENSYRDYNAKEISLLINRVYEETDDNGQIRILKDMQYIITNDFYHENASYLDAFQLFSLKTSNDNCNNKGEIFNYKRVWNIQPHKNIIDLYNKQRFSSKCLVDVVSRINHNYYVSQRTNDYYHIAAQKIAPSFNHESQKYEYHPLLPNIKEIVVSLPVLYFIQSIVTLTSQTGYVPVPSGMSPRFLQIYLDSYYSDFLLIDMQMIYYVFVNFWYVFCFFTFLIAFSIKNKDQRNLHLLLSILPLYYGAFIAFASYGEFARLMLPIIPFVLYCGIFVPVSLFTMLFYNWIINNNDINK